MCDVPSPVAFNRPDSAATYTPYDSSTLVAPAPGQPTGKSLVEHVGRIAGMIDETGSKTLLDYGCGKGLFYQPFPGEDPESRFKSMKAWGTPNIGSRWLLM